MRARYWICAGSALFVALAACDLNPQPIPPGEQSDGGVDDNGASGGGSNTATPEGPDGAVFGSGDAGHDAPSDSASDAESGDAGDAGD